MKIEVMFTRVQDKPMVIVDVAQIPRQGDALSLNPDEGAYFVDCTIFYADPKRGYPVAQVRVK